MSSESSNDAVSLEIYLDKNSYCVRSVTYDNTPYLEFENTYDSKSKKMLQSIEENSLDENLIPFFSGIDERNLDFVKCKVTDCRNDKKKEERNLTLVNRHTYFKTDSSEESEPKYEM